MEAMECSTPPEEGEEAREQGSWLEGLLTFRDVGCSVLRHLDAVDFARLSISSRHLRVGPCHSTRRLAGFLACSLACLLDAVDRGQLSISSRHLRFGPCSSGSHAPLQALAGV